MVTTKPRKTEMVSFRLTAEQRKMLRRASHETRKDEGEFVRDLVLSEIDKIASLRGWKAA